MMISHEFKSGYEEAARDIFDSLERSLLSYRNGSDVFLYLDIAMSKARAVLKFDPFGEDEGYLREGV